MKGTSVNHTSSIQIAGRRGQRIYTLLLSFLLDLDQELVGVGIE